MQNKALEIIKEALHETIDFIMKENNSEIEEKNEEDISAFLQNYVTIIGVSGQIKGEIIFSFSDSIIKKVASKMTGREIKEVDKLSLSAIVEFANMLSGAATIKLVDEFETEKLDMSPPVIIKGKEFKISSKIGTLKNYRLKVGKEDVIFIRINLLEILQK